MDEPEEESVRFRMKCDKDSQEMWKAGASPLDNGNMYVEVKKGSAYCDCISRTAHGEEWFSVQGTAFYEAT